MRYTRNCIIAIVSMLLILALAGCQQSGTTVVSAVPTPARTAQPQRDKESQVVAEEEDTHITLGVAVSDAAVVNPFQTVEADLYSLNHLVYESVVELDDDQRPSPLLADRWQKNGYSWTFYLRNGVTFHNGVAVTADDVAASYQKIMALGEDHPYFERIQPIRSMEVVDAHTLHVSMRTVGYDCIYAMTFPVAQRATLDDYYPMGSGAYWFVSPHEGEFLRLEKNPFWWKRQPYIDIVSVKRYPDSEHMMAAFELDEIDALATRSGVVSLSRKLSDRSTLDYTTLVYECLVPNAGMGLLADPQMRQALMYGIDRGTLASGIYQDLVQMSEVPVLPGTWLNESQSTTYYYSPERALQILYSLGWSDSDGNGRLDRIQDGLMQELEITLITYDEPDSSARYDAANMMAEQLARIGVTVNVQVMTKTGVRNAMREDSFDLALVAYNLSEAPQLDFMFSSIASSNYSNYMSGEMDSLLANVHAAETEDALQQAMSRVQLQIVEDLPIMGLFFRSGVVVSDRGVAGLSGVRSTQTFRGFEFWQVTEE